MNHDLVAPNAVPRDDHNVRGSVAAQIRQYRLGLGILRKGSRRQNVARFHGQHRQAVFSRQQKGSDRRIDRFGLDAGEKRQVVVSFQPGGKVLAFARSGEFPHAPALGCVDAVDHPVVQGYDNVVFSSLSAQVFHDQGVCGIQIPGPAWCGNDTIAWRSANGSREHFFLGGDAGQSQDVAQLELGALEFLAIGVAGLEFLRLFLFVVLQQLAGQLPYELVVGSVGFGVQGDLYLV
mmetsp:Transcript_9629/g.23345  ORF Transcript_9629/g.23345 Transcript_9629/m.23345 type:complete len:235 (-) Transcript_9629:1809-2513(-)